MNIIIRFLSKVSPAIAALLLIPAMGAAPVMAGALSYVITEDETTHASAFSEDFDSAFEADPMGPPAPVIDNDDFSYQLNSDDTVTIAGYNGKEDTIIIPEVIDGHTVSAIGSDAFYHADLKSVSIPDCVTEIKPDAFEYCTISDSLTLPFGVNIGNNAFAYATLPEFLTIPGYSTIGIESFAYCTGLKTLYAESGAAIGKRAFNYSKDLVSLVCEDYVTIEDRAFEYIDSLENVILTEDVKIVDDPFSYCDSAQISYVDKNELEKTLAALEGSESKDSKDKKQDKLPGKTSEQTQELSVGDLTFEVPSDMQNLKFPGYDLYYISSDGSYHIGAALYPYTMLDFENDDDIKTMTEAARDFVDIEDYYKVRICGHPAVWINVRSPEEAAVGTYLYISTDNGVYYIMFLSLAENREPFKSIFGSVKFSGSNEGTDVSDVPDMK